jgi:hypothetical protein
MFINRSVTGNKVRDTWQLAVDHQALLHGTGGSHQRSSGKEVVVLLTR